MNGHVAIRPTTVEMLERLVSFDTTRRHSNLALIGFIRDWLDANAVPYRISTDSTGQKANIHAILGPHEPGGIALSGHVDTVPVDGQSWSGDPFTLRRANGRLTGRGA
ncbi:MAG TPA: M20/M25/M40 family metallo-hydrolase, partial [Rhizomicrobium sp.]